MTSQAEISLRPDAMEISIPRHYCRPGYSFQMFWLEEVPGLFLRELPNRQGVQPSRFRSGVGMAVLSFPPLDPTKKAAPTIYLPIQVTGRNLLIVFPEEQK